MYLLSQKSTRDNCFETVLLCAVITILLICFRATRSDEPEEPKASYIQWPLRTRRWIECCQFSCFCFASYVTQVWKLNWTLSFSPSSPQLNLYFSKPGVFCQWAVTIRQRRRLPERGTVTRWMPQKVQGTPGLSVHILYHSLKALLPEECDAKGYKSLHWQSRWGGSLQALSVR